MRVDLIHGPNLNWLGRREPEIYGRLTLPELELRLRREWPHMELSCFQSNHEGELVDRLQWAADHVDGVVINPGGLSHTSVVLLDALRALAIPVVEVHLSHVLGREEFRRNLLTAQGASALVSGLGVEGYAAALRHLAEVLADGETR